MEFGAVPASGGSAGPPSTAQTRPRQPTCPQRVSVHRQQRSPGRLAEYAGSSRSNVRGRAGSVRADWRLASCRPPRVTSPGGGARHGHRSGGRETRWINSVCFPARNCRHRTVTCPTDAFRAPRRRRAHWPRGRGDRIRTRDPVTHESKGLASITAILGSEYCSAGKQRGESPIATHGNEPISYTSTALITAGATVHASPMPGGSAPDPQSKEPATQESERNAQPDSNTRTPT